MKIKFHFLLISLSLLLLFSCKEPKNIDISQLKGTWEFPKEPSCTFGDSTITYLDTKESYNYEVIGDSLITIYFNKPQSFVIVRLNNEELEIKNKYQEGDIKIGNSSQESFKYKRVK